MYEPPRSYKLGIDPMHYHTIEEWLEIEAKDDAKHDYWDGILVDVIHLSGGTREHSRILRNLVQDVGTTLKTAGTSCEIFSSELRIQVEENGKYFYPDATIVCNAKEGSITGSITNPIAIFEATSLGSYGYDRGTKWHKYRRLDTLRHYILIDSLSYHVEHRHRERSDQDIWRADVYTSLNDFLSLSEVDLKLSLADIYYNVDLHGAPPRQPVVLAENIEDYGVIIN